MNAPARRVVDVGGVAMSALVCAVPEPRAVIVAVHGGAATSAYFDAPNQPRLSLLRTAQALGFAAIALDRPGYGSSAPYPDRMGSARQRIDLAYAAVEEIIGDGGRGAGVFLVGHSMGCALAVRMAADARGADLLGLAIAGIGLHYQPRASAALKTKAMHDLIWGPRHLYPAGAARGIGSPVPFYERDEVRRWPGDFPQEAERVRVPVHYCLGDHERVWRAGQDALADIAALFTASPRVMAEEQPGGGHNLSIGLSAAAYHLRILSFAEECVLARDAAAAPMGG